MLAEPRLVPPARPCIKWAGGKRWQLEHLLPIIQERLTRRSFYYEPFAGGAAVFLALAHPNSYLADINADLMNVYSSIRDDCWGVARELRRRLDQYNEGPQKGIYLAARFEWNNPGPRQPLDTPARAALFLFLNRACFNGLYRENKKGQFNVPWGQKPKIDWAGMAESLVNVAEALKGASVHVGPFERMASWAQPSDVVYLDPPYLLDGFTSYTAGGFTWDDHRRLVQMARELKARGVHVIASGSDTALTRQTYEDTFVLTPVVARRSIGAKNREKASEVIMIA
jgi:DNA adenine methylase